MKIEFIKRGAETRLILLFAGWSTDARYYSDCIVDGWDTAVISDYRDMTMPELPSQYSTIYVFAYSLGVYAAAQSNVNAAARIAICGSPNPVSDEFGIPENIYYGTLDGLNVRSLMKFHIRMAGSRMDYEKLKHKLPSTPDIENLKEELRHIALLSKESGVRTFINFDKAYIAKEDNIFPYGNLSAYWDTHEETVTVSYDGPHAVDIAKIVKECIPDTRKICESFERAQSTYGKHAVVQAEICEKMGAELKSLLDGKVEPVTSLLEIGVGGGQLTKVWKEILTPKSATYVDLFKLPMFGIAEKENYIAADVEEWLKTTDETYDAILSASTIQWISDPVGFIGTVRKHLNPGGFAIISTFVKGNLHELDAVRPCPIIYRSAEDYAAVSDKIIEKWERTISFATPREMMMHLRHTGVSPRQNRLSFENKPVGTTITGKLTNLPTSLTYMPLILLVRAT